MDIAAAQQDMRYTYLAGATGVVVSACVWLTAALVALNGTATHSMLTLFFGGMLIFPLSLLLGKLLGRPSAHRRDNPLGSLALEGTAILILGMALAYGASLSRIEWFYPAMLAVIGMRYLTFKTLYGLKTYWLLGATLVFSAWLLLALNAPFYLGALTGSAIEFLFFLPLLRIGRAEKDWSGL